MTKDELDAAIIDALKKREAARLAAEQKAIDDAKKAADEAEAARIEAANLFQQELEKRIDPAVLAALDAIYDERSAMLTYGERTFLLTAGDGNTASLQETTRRPRPGHIEELVLDPNDSAVGTDALLCAIGDLAKVVIK